ncbi:hypothetical protein ACFYY2_29695 [Streptomyces sp. NPDC001822]|uniref:hypothetical protein n=1 Tax=Streptomyces sp. NPDC001822 TaxID=3364614 RepID=UPI0036AE7B54
MDAKTPQEIGAYALSQAVRYADQAAHYVTSSPSVTEAHAPLIATLGGLAGAYADIARAAAVTADNV